MVAALPVGCRLPPLLAAAAALLPSASAAAAEEQGGFQNGTATGAREWRPIVVLADIACGIAVWQMIVRIIEWRRSTSYQRVMSFEECWQETLQQHEEAQQHQHQGPGVQPPRFLKNLYSWLARWNWGRLRITKSPPVDATKHGLVGFRRDCWSRCSDGCEAVALWVANFKAQVESTPCALMLRCARARASFMYDLCGDLLVACLLFQHYFWCSVAVASLTLLPYVVLAFLLWPKAWEKMQGGGGVLDAVPVSQRCRDSVRMMGSHRCSALILWAVVGIPYLLAADVYLNFRHFLSEPHEVETSHYLALRNIVEGAAEADIQLPLQMYIWVCILPASPGGALPWLLAFNALSSGRAVWQAYHFVGRFAELQAQGSWAGLLARMCALDPALPPAWVLEEVEMQSKVVVSADLSQMDVSGLGSLCKVARNTPTLETLVFSDASFLVNICSSPGGEVRCGDALRDLVRCPSLRHLEFCNASLPKPLVDRLWEELQQHPRLAAIKFPQSERTMLCNEIAESMSNQPPVLRAVWREDVVALRTVLHSGRSSGRFAERASPERACQEMVVHLAARRGNAAVLRELLLAEDGPACTERRDHRGRAALHVAAQNGHAAAAEVLLVAGADVGARDGLLRTPLLLAAAEGGAAAVGVLADWLADLAACDKQGNTPLCVAAQKGHQSVVQELLGRGTAVDQCGRDDATPLFLASQHGHLHVVSALLDFHADVEREISDGATPLYIASRQGHGPIVKALLARYAAINNFDEDGLPISILLPKAHWNYVEPRAHQPNKNWAKGACLKPLFGAAEQGHLPILRTLLGFQADVNEPLADGSTPLFLASLNGHLPVVLALLERQADVEQAKHSGATALFLAAQDGHLSVVNALLEHRADTNRSKTSGVTPLFVTSRHGHLGVTEALLQHGARADRAAVNGATPLLLAAQAGHLAVGRALLACRAQPDKEMTDGTTALIAAAHFGHEGFCLSLLSYGADRHRVASENPILGSGTAADVAERQGHQKLSLALR